VLVRIHRDSYRAASSSEQPGYLLRANPLRKSNQYAEALTHDPLFQESSQGLASRNSVYSRISLPPQRIFSMRLLMQSSIWGDDPKEL
jgi:hypothetical protein